MGADFERASCSCMQALELVIIASVQIASVQQVISGVGEHMKTSLVLTTAALTAFTTAAFAADLPSRHAPAVYVPPPPIFSWTGFYIGALAGAASDRSDIATTVDPGTHLGLPANLSAVAASGTSSGHKVGVLAGGEVGYNYQINSFVLGVEGDAEYLDANRKAFGSGVFTTGDTFVISSAIRENLFASIRGRVGYTFDRVLLFASGGAAFTDRRLTQTYADTLLATTGAVSASSSTVGYAIGGGVEYALTDNWSVKAEYLYARFGGTNAAYTITNTAGSSNLVHVSTGREELHIGRVGLNYRFGSAAPVVARY